MAPPVLRVSNFLHTSCRRSTVLFKFYTYRCIFVFRCSQCFRPFPDGLFYEFEGRKYCEHDFQVLFAPCCGKCGEFVIGRVIKAMSASWHPACFCCAVCNKELADRGFVRNRNRALCHECNAADKAVLLGKHICFKCQYVIVSYIYIFFCYKH